MRVFLILVASFLFSSRNILMAFVSMAHLRNDLLCVESDVNLYSLTRPFVSVCVVWLSRATIMQMQGSSLGQADTGSVALPAVLRAGETGPAQFSVGSVQPAKFSTTSHQAHTGHMRSTVCPVSC